MSSLLITGFETKAQVEEFVHWYEGQGEQDAVIWLEDRRQEGLIDVNFMPVDINKPLFFNEEQATLTLKMLKAKS